MRPHTSAGRLPTQLGLRFYVDALLEFGGLAREERARIDNQVRAAAEEGGFEGALTQATALLSDLTHGAGVVAHLEGQCPPQACRIRPPRAGAGAGGAGRRGRLGREPRRRHARRHAGFDACRGGQLSQRPRRAAARSPKRAKKIARARDAARGELDALAARLVDAGLASWAGAEEASRQLIVRGQANLIGDLHADADLERIRRLFADLETQTDVIDLLHRAENGEGVKIFIGSENKLFSLSGSSMIAAPLRGGDRRVGGVLGVIGPTRLNYGRIVPMVEYAAQVLGDLKRPR